MYNMHIIMYCVFDMKSNVYNHIMLTTNRSELHKIFLLTHLLYTIFTGIEEEDFVLCSPHTTSSITSKMHHYRLYKVIVNELRDS